MGTKGTVIVAFVLVAAVSFAQGGRDFKGRMLKNESECDPVGAKSVCEFIACHAGHERLKQRTNCHLRKVRKVCCRFLCAGEQSMCIPDSGVCPSPHIPAKSDTPCSLGYKCCKIPNAK